jgi:predicted sulfurtransferase
MPKEKRSREKADSTVDRPKKAQVLGAWNPKALVVKAEQQEDSTSLVLFYQYVQPLWSDSRRQEAVDMVTAVGLKMNLGGRVRIAREGFNATVSGTYDTVREFAKELGKFDKHFLETDFKYIDGLLPDKAFKDLKVIPVAELVFYGFSSEEALSMGEGGEHLDPKDYHNLMKQPDAVIIDVR